MHPLPLSTPIYYILHDLIQPMCSAAPTLNKTFCQLRSSDTVCGGESSIVTAIRAPKCCWFVPLEVFVYSYTSPFSTEHFVYLSCNPSGSQRSCHFLIAWLFHFPSKNGSSFLAFSRGRCLPMIYCHQKRD
jgi:hypothetical protein